MLPIKEEVGNFDSYSLNNAKCSKLNCLFVCVSLGQSNISDCQIHNIILLPFQVINGALRLSVLQKGCSSDDVTSGGHLESLS